MALQAVQDLDHVQSRGTPVILEKVIDGGIEAILSLVQEAVQGHIMVLIGQDPGGGEATIGLLDTDLSQGLLQGPGLALSPVTGGHGPGLALGPVIGGLALGPVTGCLDVDLGPITGDLGPGLVLGPITGGLGPGLTLGPVTGGLGPGVTEGLGHDLEPGQSVGGTMDLHAEYILASEEA